MRKRGRPRGTKRIHPDRDRLTHFVVEWVILRTGLGIGRGLAEADKADACVVASWILTYGQLNAEYLRDYPKAAGLLEALRVDVNVFQHETAAVRGRETVLNQLRRMSPRAVRNAYQRWQKQRPAIPSMREQVRHAERIRSAFGDELEEEGGFLI